jgi:hypothetical protein
MVRKNVIRGLGSGLAIAHFVKQERPSFAKKLARLTKRRKVHSKDVQEKIGQAKKMTA